MFSVTIAFGATSWRLLFKDGDKAENTFSAITQPVDKTQHFHAEERITFIDDFGQKACFKRAAVDAVMLENMDESKLGAIELALHNARMQASGQQRAEADPTLRAARMTGAPILTPMGNGRMS